MDEVKRRTRRETAGKRRAWGAVYGEQTHLENCTGRKKPKEKLKGSAEEKNRKRGTETDKSEMHSLLNSLRKVDVSEREKRRRPRKRRRAREPAGRSSEKERREDAKALIADEGRDKLRKAQGSRK